MAHSSGEAGTDKTHESTRSAIRNFARLIARGTSVLPGTSDERCDGDMLRTLAGTLDSLSELVRMTDTLRDFTAMLEQELRHEIASRTRSEA